MTIVHWQRDPLTLAAGVQGSDGTAPKMPVCGFQNYQAYFRRNLSPDAETEDRLH